MTYEWVCRVWSTISSDGIINDTIQPGGSCSASIDPKMTRCKVNRGDESLNDLCGPLRNKDKACNEVSVHSIPNNLEYRYQSHSYYRDVSPYICFPRDRPWQICGPVFEEFRPSNSYRW